jgi:hypothetical protein
MAQRTPITTQTLDQLLKKNQRLLRKNQHLMGKMTSLRSTMNSQSPVEQVQTLDYLTGKNQQLREKNKELLGEIASVRRELVEPSEARTKVKAGKIIAHIAAWFYSSVRRAFE